MNFTLLNKTICLSQPRIAEAALVALYNLCNNEQCQTHLASAPGLCLSAIRICEYAKESYLAGEASTLLLAIMWRNPVNKARVGTTKDSCKILMKRLIHCCTIAGMYSNNDAINNINTTTNNNNTRNDTIKNMYEHIFCIERTAYALSSMLLHEHMHELMHNINGFEEVAELCKQYKNDRILRALSQILVAMQPSPDFLVVC